MNWVNGDAQGQIELSNRGLSYGDGLFETFRVAQGQVVLEPQHWSRLRAGCERLALPLDLPRLRQEFAEALSFSKSQFGDDAIIKVTVTRGGAGRGYAPELNAPSVRIIQCFPAPSYPHKNPLGITVCFCQTPLSINPVLGGLKHLCRLENVLARAELDGTDYDEGLCSTIAGDVVEGTMSNLFLVFGSKLVTPSLGDAGVAGTVRQWILDVAVDRGVEVEERPCLREDIVSSDELFVCNSVFGIWPVTRLDDLAGRTGAAPMKLLKDRGPQTKKWQQWLQQQCGF